jgi:hypothetical protein
MHSPITIRIERFNTAAQSAFSFTDPEMSKRFARAVMHAALLCGGTKAVSPF